jgi:hypothetical protein
MVTTCTATLDTTIEVLGPSDCTPRYIFVMPTLLPDTKFQFVPTPTDATLGVVELNVTRFVTSNTDDPNACADARTRVVWYGERAVHAPNVVPPTPTSALSVASAALTLTFEGDNTAKVTFVVSELYCTRSSTLDADDVCVLFIVSEHPVPPTGICAVTALRTTAVVLRIVHAVGLTLVAVFVRASLSVTNVVIAYDGGFVPSRAVLSSVGDGVYAKMPRGVAACTTTWPRRVAASRASKTMPCCVPVVALTNAYPPVLASVSAHADTTFAYVPAGTADKNASCTRTRKIAEPVVSVSTVPLAVPTMENDSWPVKLLNDAALNCAF